IDEIADLDVPYVWVKGRHDSMGTQRAVESQSNAVVLDGDTEEVEGLTFYGSGDPRYTPDETRLDPDENEVAAQGAEEAERGADGPEDVDVTLQDGRTQAEALDGVVPLVLTGDEHLRATELTDQGTRFLVQGSPGRAGLSGLDNDSDLP